MHADNTLHTKRSNILGVHKDTHHDAGKKLHSKRDTTMPLDTCTQGDSILDRCTQTGTPYRPGVHKDRKHDAVKQVRRDGHRDAVKQVRKDGHHDAVKQVRRDIHHDAVKQVRRD